MTKSLGSEFGELLERLRKIHATLKRERIPSSSAVVGAVESVKRTWPELHGRIDRAKGATYAAAINAQLFPVWRDAAQFEARWGEAEESPKVASIEKGKIKEEWSFERRVAVIQSWAMLRSALEDALRILAPVPAELADAGVGVVATKKGTRRGRLKKDDSRARRMAMLAFIGENPTLKYNYDALGLEADVHPATVRRWIEAEHKKMTRPK